MRSLRELMDESGQVIIVTALCMVVLIGFVGLAVDVGYIQYEKRRLQSAADAAALAAALEVRVCGTTTNCSAMQTAASTALSENGYSNATVSSGCTLPTSSTLTLTLNNPVCLVAGDPNATKVNYVEALVTETVQGYFSQLLGFTGFKLTARAEAAHGLGGPCIYALNPSASGALNVAVGPWFQIKLWCGGGVKQFYVCELFDWPGRDRTGAPSVTDGRRSEFIVPGKHNMSRSYPCPHERIRLHIFLHRRRQMTRAAPVPHRPTPGLRLP